MTLIGNQAQRVTAVGVVIPVEWDDSGAPRSFVLSTYGEEEYLIDGRTNTGRRLMKLVHRKVKVTGMSEVGVANRRMLKVKRFEII